MKEVQWSNDLSVGIGLIDKQHQMLIEHLNNLARALESHQGPSKIVSTLSFLIDYAQFHFSTEEKHMTANNYPGLEDHKEKHDEFRKTLGDLEEDFREEGATPGLADSLDTLLVNWLIKHIQGVDIKFGEFLKAKGIVVEEED
jgi:hemerythrin-like metal-binding protein